MVLIISYYKSLQKDLEAYLKGDFPGIAIDKAFHDIEGINKIESNFRYELIISDWDIHGYVNGLKILKKVRETPAIKDTPFIIITEKQNKESVIECAKAAVTSYIMKPALSQSIDNKTFNEKLRPFIEQFEGRTDYI
ncbi:MAG: response regulator [Candidatus Magnetominusculus sp. LBB02]|nr:response regulator [Candidatus Magnetominusculus sp. LBB02]